MIRQTPKTYKWNYSLTLYKDLINWTQKSVIREFWISQALEGILSMMLQKDLQKHLWKEVHK